MFVHDTSVVNVDDGNVSESPSRAAIARELASIVEPSSFDVLLVANEAGQIDAVFRSLKSVDVFDARITSTCSAEAAQTILQLQSFDVVIGCGAIALELFAGIPELPVRSATLVIADYPTAEVTAQALTSGAMAILATDEISSNLLQRTLQQILLRREAQTLLLNRLDALSAGTQTPGKKLISPQLLCTRSKGTGPVHEAVPSTAYNAYQTNPIWRREL